MRRPHRAPLRGWLRPAGPRLREYVEAVRAIFRAFQGQEKLNFEGDADGTKCRLGIMQGTTENKTACRDLLAKAVERGLDASARGCSCSMAPRRCTPPSGTCSTANPYRSSGVGVIMSRSRLCRLPLGRFVVVGVCGW